MPIVITDHTLIGVHKMILRDYKPKDSAEISKWINNKTSMYLWTAGRLDTFPLPADCLNGLYASMVTSDKMIPLCAVINGELIGHLLIRYPDKEDNSTVRFGFVITAPEFRGKGYGRQMIRLAVDYVKYQLKAEKITLGVFDNNERAKGCYYSAGFRLTGESKIYHLPVGDWKCVEMSLNVDDVTRISASDNIDS